MEIKTEADSNDITESPHDDKPTIGMFGLSDAVFSAFICLCMTSKPVHISPLCSTTFPLPQHFSPFTHQFCRRFGFIVRTDRQTDRITEADDRYTHVTTIGVGNKCL